MHTKECLIALKIHYCLSARMQYNRANGSLRKENAPPLFIFPEKVSHSSTIMSPFALVFTGSRHGSIEKPWVSNPAAVPARWRQCHQREAQKGRRRTQLLFSIFLSSFAKALLRNCHLVAEVYIEWKIHLLKAFDTIDVLKCTLVGVSRVGIEKMKTNRKGQQLHFYNRYQHLPCNLGVKNDPI